MRFKLFIPLRNIIRIFSLFVICLVITNCASSSDECPNKSLDDIVETKIIEQYHSEFFPDENVSNSNDRVGVYVDFSDGITKFCLNNENNKNVYKKFFASISNLNNSTDYFELSNDSLIQYPKNNIVDYFQGSGFKTADGKYKIGAPIDKAINKIVDSDNVGVLITDGELYDKRVGAVSKEMWASKAFAKWFKKGNKIEIVYTDFIENNNGKEYKKHMYIMFFIPNNSENKILENYLADLKADNLDYKTLSFSTNISNMYVREYKNAQTPGADKYLEYFTETEAYYPSPKRAFEFIDFSVAPFSLNDDGLVYYLRDSGDENGKKKNYPLLDKLFFRFDMLNNYDVNKIKIVVHDINDDFNNFKRNLLAKENPPSLVKNSNGKDSLTVENYLVFDCLTTIDEEEPYNIINKSQQDTINNFRSILSNDFVYAKKTFDISDLGVQDFLFLDQTAGEVNQANDSGKYEIVLKFNDQLNENTKGLNNDRPNLFRVDIILEEAVVEDMDETALTWDKIDNSGKDEALYLSLKNTMKDNIPKGVIYSYYLKFGPFNQ
ncbi:hypothetical protein [Aequorivita sp. CIP111184]|uniref:hypothetical protein n=1 Tax=Aequorivita sp. CIP111184 TaxID=2211356 RepID=UPI000DBBE455|nr:hypothetical protein [Aequorivita sp. CIP111184]SRX56218.1 hypothetical protein AEQU1_03248 [Aequorivita sp. CIP111184]